MARYGFRAKKDLRSVKTDLFMLIAMALAARNIFFLVTAQPVSTDVWPLIGASSIITNTPWVKIWNDTVFDGYNNKWPAVILTAAILKLTIDSSFETIYGTILSSSLTVATILLFHVFVVKLCRRNGYSPLALAVLALAPSIVIFTASALKEVYAYPFLALTLWAIKASKTLPIVALATAAIVLSHPLTPLILVSTFTSIIIITFIFHIGSNISLPKIVYLLILVSLAYTTYMNIYALKAINYSILPEDLLAAILYLLFFSYIASMRTRISKIASIISVLVLTPLATVLPLLPIQYVSRKGVEIYLAAPLSAILMLSIAGRGGCREVNLLARGMAATVSALTAFITFRAIEFSTIIHRVAHYSLFVIAMLGYTMSRSAVRLLTILLSATFVLHAWTLLMSVDEVSSPWLYSIRDRYIMAITSLVDERYRILCDAKYYYLLRYYSNIEVEMVSPGDFQVSDLRKTIIMVTEFNILHGFEAGGQLHRLDPKTKIKILKYLSKIIDVSGAAFNLGIE